MKRLEEILKRCEAAKEAGSRYYSADCYLVTQALMKAVEGLNEIGLVSHNSFMKMKDIDEQGRLLVMRGQTARNTLAEIEKMLGEGE